MEPPTINNPVIFAGPDLRLGRLSDEISSSIINMPAAGTIYWLCYYFQNTTLGKDLKNAADLGINVKILLEKQPRFVYSNSAILKTQPNIFLLVSKIPWWALIGIRWKPHFHEKIYYFSHPIPHAYVGSYNPSDDETNDDEFNREVGDHSISHNVLVKITQPEVVTFIHEHCYNMHRWIYRTLSRYWPDRSKSFANNHYEVFLWPRLRSPFHKIAQQMGSGDRIRAAVSHLKGPGVLGFFRSAKRKGVTVELLLETSERRVPRKILMKLEQLGIHYTQLELPPNCLMHNKFILIEQREHHSVIFGSVNWSTRSQWLNHEIAIRTDEPEIVQAFEKRWAELVDN